MFRTRSLSDDRIEATFALNTVTAFARTRHLQGAPVPAAGRVADIATGFLGENWAK